MNNYIRKFRDYVYIYTVQRNIIANKKPTTINDRQLNPKRKIGIVQFFPIVYSRNSKKKRKKRVANWIVQVRNKRVVKRRVKKKKKARDHDGERSIETKTERRGERERRDGGEEVCRREEAEEAGGVKGGGGGGGGE